MALMRGRHEHPMIDARDVFFYLLRLDCKSLVRKALRHKLQTHFAAMNHYHLAHHLSY
jgi:hypothetical protein